MDTLNSISATSPLIGVPDREQREAVLADYLPAHHRIARRFGISPDVDALTRFAAWYTPPADARGAVLLDDAMFLRDMVRAIRPATMVELGTASGVSTAVLLKSMSAAPAPESWRVESFDLLSHCYWDAAVPVGYAIGIMTPDLLGRATLHAPGVASDIARRFSPRDLLLPLIFIDACHKHPYPVADLLGVLPALAPGAWVILHDINLPARAAAYELQTGESVHWGERGAKLLFDFWPHDKITGGGDVPNIGAIRLPESTAGAAFDPSTLAPLINEPWECDPDVATRDRLAAAKRSGLGVRLARALRRMANKG